MTSHARANCCRAAQTIFDVTELAHHGPEDVFISMLTFIGAFVVMLTIEWRLALVLIAVVPVMLIFVMNLRKRMSRTSRKVKEGMAVINSQIESSISGARVAKAFTNEDYEISKFEQETAFLSTPSLRITKLWACLWREWSFSQPSSMSLCLP